MAKPEWGTKRKCLKCGTFFYDMNKETFSCPKCKDTHTKMSFDEEKTKQLLKMAKKNSSRIEDEDIDEETLLQMTEDVPLSDEDLGPDELEILDDDSELTDTDEADFSNMRRFTESDEENHARE
ncbi:MAG: TIGR02300 family protein [Alphaproteobacteria bacterium]|nr:TIGR02300 family protein [Alphaproteobacteria bacterium]